MGEVKDGKELNDEKKDEAEDKGSNGISTSPAGKSFELGELSSNQVAANTVEAKPNDSQIIPNLDDDTKEKVKVEDAGLEILQLLTLFILKASTTLTRLLDGRGGPKSIKLNQKIPCRILDFDERKVAFGSTTLK